MKIKRKFRTFLLALSLTVPFVGVLVNVSKANEAILPVEAAQVLDNFAPYTYSGNYYDSITAEGEGLNGSLRTALTNHIYPASTPTYSGSSSSNALAYLLQDADENPNKSSEMIYLYTRDSVAKNPAQSWNREHVWPQSLSNGYWGKTDAGSDLLHIRPTYVTTNSTRGNDIFGYASTPKYYNGMEYGKKSGGKFEPLDSVKGDVARIIMYVWVAYQNKYSNMPKITQVFESYNTLLEWHTLDRPDVMEGNRNDIAETSLQKNRNLFVDHPEYAWKIFGDSASSSVKNACMEAYPGNAAQLLSLEVTKLPYKTTYYVGGTLDKTGLVVRGHYDNGTSKDVTSFVTLSPMTLNTLGTQVITVSYLGKTTSFNVEVVTPQTVDLTGVSVTTSEVSLKEGQTHNIRASYLPNNAYPYPEITYSSSAPTIASVNGNGFVTAKTKGVATITVTAKQGSIVKTTTIRVVVTEANIDKISDIYSKSSGADVKFYGQFIGAYNEQNQGIFVGDGDYAIMLYNYQGSVSSFIPYKTYVLVTGKVSIFNNLYEVGSNTSSPTITVVSEEVGKTRVSPVTTYLYTGEEDGNPSSDDYDASIQSRPTMGIGTVQSVSGSFIETADTTVILKHENGKQLTVFVKKNAGLDYAKLKQALGTVGKHVRVKGYLSIYKTSIQLILPTIVEEDITYKAVDFAQDLLNATNDICNDGGLENNRNDLLAIWVFLEQNDFIRLSVTERNLLKSASANASSTDVVAKGMARYDYVVGKYALSDFIGRNPATIGVQYHSNLNTNNLIRGVIIVCATLGAFAITGYLIKRRKEQ